LIEDFIECHRFGGKRPASACVHFDRYRLCRRHCTALKAFLKDRPNFIEDTKKEREAPKVKIIQTLLFDDAKHSGKNLPDPILSCDRCRFVAKSVRGLKVHRTRSHKTWAT